MRFNHIHPLALTLITAFLVFSLGTYFVLAQEDTLTLELKFVNHIQMGLAEQDVYIQTGEGTVERVQVTTSLSALYDTLYAAASAVPHDPFAVLGNPYGPYEQGDSLNVSLSDWLAAQGTGTYTVHGEEATLYAEFTDLMPEGVYTLWCSRVTYPPNFEAVDRPCGAADGSENVMIADENGRATFELSLPALEPSTAETMTIISVAYHSDGKTYGASAGDFGQITHLQVAAILPVVE